MPHLPKLPMVDGKVIHALGAELRENPDYIDETYSRLETEQPALIRALGAFIEAGARDSYEEKQLKEVLVLTYRMLEAQAKADELEAQINGPDPNLT